MQYTNIHQFSYHNTSFCILAHLFDFFPNRFTSLIIGSSLLTNRCIPKFNLLISCQELGTNFPQKWCYKWNSSSLKQSQPNSLAPNVAQILYVCYKNSWKYYISNYNGKIIKINELNLSLMLAFNDQQVYLENGASGDPKENFLSPTRLQKWL